MKKVFTFLTAFMLLNFNVISQAASPAEECKRLFDESLAQQAILACTEAAETNNRPAQSTLGELYDQQGNAELAKHWWMQAAQSGYQPARNLLAMKYYYGGSVFGPEKGWQQDYAKAFEIWRLDADREIASSQFMVGVMYYKGEGIEKNYSEAWFWLKLSLANGYKLATDVLIELSREISPQQKQSGTEKLARYQSEVKAGVSQ